MLRLRRLARVVNGGTPTSDEANWGGNVRWATPADLARVDGGFLSQTDRALTSIGLRRGSALVPAGSVLVSSRAPIGYVALAQTAMAFNQGCKGLVPFAGVDGGYVRYWLTAQRSALQAAGSGSTFMELSGDALKEFAIPDRSELEQRRIADFLDDQVARIDNIIAARRSQIRLVSASRQAEVISRALAGGDLNGHGSTAWYRNLPPAWPLRPLRAAWQVIDCKHRTPAYIDAGYPVVSPGDISPTPLDLRRCHRFVGEADYADLADPARRCRIGDIVYSRNASAGTAALVTTDEPFTMGQDVCRITSGRRSQRYLYYLLNYAVAPQLESARVGSTFTRINIDEIKALRVPVPAEDEQERISTDLDALSDEFDAIVATEIQQIALMGELKRSLITAAVTGEFDVSSADGSRVLA